MSFCVVLLQALNPRSTKKKNNLTHCRHKRAGDVKASQHQVSLTSLFLSCCFQVDDFTISVLDKMKKKLHSIHLQSARCCEQLRTPIDLLLSDF